MEKYIFLHGLGQTPSSWTPTLSLLTIQNPICADLFSVKNQESVDYTHLYKRFEALCEATPEPLHLCGISLGAVLALHYAVTHSQRVKSLILIAPQDKMPRLLLRIQNLIFRFIPEKKFAETGIRKKELLLLTSSMMKLNFRSKLHHITCPVMVICGSRDKINRTAAVHIQRRLQNAQLHWIENVGHEVNREAPQQLAERIKDFWHM